MQTAPFLFTVFALGVPSSRVWIVHVINLVFSIDVWLDPVFGRPFSLTIERF